MRIELHQIALLEAFLGRLAAQTYPEPPSELHTSVIDRMLNYAIGKYPPEGPAILDVGCGQGAALERFTAAGFRPVGITLNEADLEACLALGYDVRLMDQSFLEFAGESFDLVWCRHCIEHSFAPLFTLSGFRRVLKAGGTLYLEAPAPDTCSKHQSNVNHYSVLGQSMWSELIRRAGFELLEVLNINIRLRAGLDTYWAFIGRAS